MTLSAKQGPIARIAAALMLATALAAPSFAQETPAPAAPATEAPAAPAPDAVVATVGDMTITEADLALVAQDLQDQLQQVPAEQRRAFLVTVLVDMKVMAKAAREAGLDQADSFKQRMSYLGDRSLRQAYFAEKVAGAVNDEKIKAAYDAYVAAFQPAEEVHARHILVATEEEAKAVKAEIDGGKPFEMVAMEKTTDPSGKQNGGDLGFFQKGQMVAAFEAVAFTLEPGTVSDPVQSDFGWHIIKVEEKRMTTPAPIEQLEQQLAQQVIYQEFEAVVGPLKAANPVVISDPTLAEQVKQQSEPQGAATP
jgi:peptidyl-prolyl cis-trans isomerase C